MTDPDRPLRALWLIKGLGPGGAEQLLVQQATVRHRDRLAVDVAYLLPHKDHLVGDLEAAGVGVLCLDGRRDLDPRWVLRLRALLLDGDYDVVHVHAPLVAAVVRLVLRTIPAARRPALVSTEHNRWPRHHPATRWANAATLPFDDVTFAVSADVVSTMPSRLGCARLRPRLACSLKCPACSTCLKRPRKRSTSTVYSPISEMVLVGSVSSLAASSNGACGSLS